MQGFVKEICVRLFLLLSVKLIHGEIVNATHTAAAGAKEVFTDLFAKLILLQSNPLMDVEVTVDENSKFILKVGIYLISYKRLKK